KKITDKMFFLSSRRRHTRSKRDWSSDVCSSDLDTSKLPVLKNDEMRKLFRQIQEDNDASTARETLVNGNLRLVLSVIKRFNNRGENVNDLFQVGCIGLMKSIDN